MQTEIEAARGLVYHAAWLKDTHPGKLGAASSKAQAVCQRDGEPGSGEGGSDSWELGVFAGVGCGANVQGRAGDTIYEGTSEIQRTIIARELLGAPGKRV